MKKLLLSSVLFAAVGSVAHAQIPVTDAGSILQEVKTVQNGIQQLQQLQSQLTQLQSIYSTVSGTRNLSGVLSAASQLGMTNNLPVNAFAVQGLLNGNGSITGMTGSIGSLFNTNYASNNAYTCTNTTLACQTLQTRANAIAGQQSLAGELYQEVSSHITILQGLQGELALTPDAKSASMLNGQIAAQQASIQQLNAQTSALAVMQNAATQQQNLVEQEKDQQAIQQELDSISDKP